MLKKIPKAFKTRRSPLTKLPKPAKSSRPPKPKLIADISKLKNKRL